MNKNQVQKLRITIEKSRARIMSKAPSFALLLMYIRFVAVPGMDRISTNGSCIFFDPYYLNKLKDDELDFILCHQIMHIICEDVWRPETYAFSNYHYACDLRINSILFDEGIFEFSGSHSDKIQSKLPGIKRSVSEMTIEEILENLVFDLDKFDNTIKRKYIIDSDVYWGRSPKLFGCTLIIDRESSEYLNILDEDMILADSSLKSEWQERVAMAYKSTAKSSDTNDEDSSEASSVANLLQRIIKKLKNPTIDWRKILNDFIREEICDYSFAPPDRRFSETDFFLPDFNEKDFETKDIVFMVDTSGSVDDRALASVYSEIKGALEQYNGKLCSKLAFFDCEATVPVPMSSVDDLLSIVPVGGGGTNFYSIFSCLKDEKPACIIVFTDGEAEFPDEEYARGVPVLWILNNHKVTPPWGKTVRLIYKKEGKY